MPYDNQLNRQIASNVNKILQNQINHTPNSYDLADANVGYANKKLLDETNIEQEENRLEELEESLPAPNKELAGGALGSIGGFARGTIRDTGEGSTKGAGKKKENPQKEVKELLLKRVMDGGKKIAKCSVEGGKKTPKCTDVGTLNKEVGEGKKKRGRPLKMIGGTDLGEPHNMVKPNGTTGDGKPKRIVGGRNLTPVAQMKSSGMSGQGKEKRSDIVKRIMKERGVSMIKASSIVKNENLFEKKGK
jgi:hypothetical protein